MPLRTTLDERDRELITARNFAHDSTVCPDGTVHCVLAWVDLDGDELVLNSAEGRAWPAHVRCPGHLTLTVQDAEHPSEYVTITGRPTREDHEGPRRHEGAEATIDALARTYPGTDRYPLS